MSAFKFEKLIVWQKSLDLATTVHEVSKKFPKEKFMFLHHKLRELLIQFH